MLHLKKNLNGFTLIELIIVIGIFAVISAVASVNLINGQNQSSLTGEEESIIADIKNQQINAMTGNTAGGTSPQAFGIKFNSNSYVLFSGNNYSTNTGSFTVNLNPGITIQSNLPLSNEIDFSQFSGDVGNFSDTYHTIIILKSGTNQTKTIVFNKYGVITQY